MDVFRIGTGHRSPLRKHSGMGCHGGVGGGMCVLHGKVKSMSMGL